MTPPRPPVVPLHPESTSDPAVLRWVVSRTDLPFTGRLVSAPGLDGLLATVVEQVEVGPDHLLVRLRPGHTWRQEGEGVRRGLIEALRRTGDWLGDDSARVLGPDEALRVCAAELIAGPVGEIAAMHGGSIELVEARDHVVKVRMHGACRGCPAAVITMHQRLENQLRRRVPDLAGVEEVR